MPRANTNDRAVFHFLTAEEDRAGYVRALSAALQPGGIAIFADDGPEMCSGLTAEQLVTVRTKRGFTRLEWPDNRRCEMSAIDFWYSIGSTYSYLSVMRLPEVARKSGLHFRWRPFNVRHVMVSQNNIPFKDKPAKSAHMWRDIERRAARYGLTPRLPAPYPLSELVIANQVAILGKEQGWCESYTRATYRRWIDEGQPAGEDPNLSASLTEIGLDPHRVLEAARADRLVAALALATEEAMRIGIFGSPSFVVKGELFWGDDRLEDAVDWARTEKIT